MNDYSYGSDGLITSTLGQRYYGGQWTKSAERQRGGKSNEESLTGWAEGKNEWKEIYSINIDRNENGLVTKEQYREKLPNIGLGEITLLTR